jgi:adenosylcobinamide kinase / adenosylcobinamide-phosphate guanylyltransferase
MARIILITGGSRSGKSSFAQQMAESISGPRAYIATCPVMDEEMCQRVKKHQAARSIKKWDTIEETHDLAWVLREKSYPVFLIDCLTLWINNLMYTASQAGKEVTEEEISVFCTDLLSECRKLSSTIILVTNEVGMGIIPDNPSARLFRDLSGRASQIIASGADSVFLMACGIPMQIKGQEVFHKNKAHLFYSEEEN